jgi:hypothetical protein
MDKKTKIIIAFMALVVLILVIVLFVVSQNTHTAENDPKSAISIPAINQSTIEVNDFYKDSLKFDRSVVMYNDSDYTIQYDDQEHSFQITFTLPTIAEITAIRQLAETTFLKKLGVSKEDACLLKVKEVIPRTEALSYEDNEFPLSFCYSATAFPKE